MSASVTRRVVKDIHAQWCRSFSLSATQCLMRRLRIADEENVAAMIKKKPKAQEKKVKRVANIQDLDSPIKALHPPQENVKYWSKKPIDDVWVTKYYPPLFFSFRDCINLHRQACSADMFDNEDGVVTANLILCMKTSKKTKFSSSYSGNALLPYIFDPGLPKRRILALSADPAEIEIAQSYGAAIAGGSEVISELLSEQLDLEAERIDTVICTLDLLQQLISAKDKLPEFPSKKAGTTGADMTTMMNSFVNGIAYKSAGHKLDEEDSRITRLLIPIGRLNMPIEQLESNWNAWQEILNSHRTSVKLGPVILRADISCPPSSEVFFLNMKLQDIPGSKEPHETQDEDEVD